MSHKSTEKDSLIPILVTFATILSDKGEEIQALKQCLSKTRQTKQAMMQELLTGKARLVNA